MRTHLALLIFNNHPLPDYCNDHINVSQHAKENNEAIEGDEDFPDIAIVNEKLIDPGVVGGGNFDKADISSAHVWQHFNYLNI